MFPRGAHLIPSSVYLGRAISHALGRAAVIAIAASMIVAPRSAHAQDQGGEDLSPYSELSLLAENTSIRPGQPFTVALRVTLDPHWHTYWVNGGDAGLPLGVRWELPDGFVAGPLQWPAPKQIPVAPLMSYGYEHQLVLLTEITPPDRPSAVTEVQITAVADWLVCDDVCLPAMGEAGLSVPQSDGPSVADPRWVDAISQTRRQLPQEPEGWRTQAWSTDEGYLLEVTAGTEMAAPYFYIDEIGVLDHAASQRVVHEGNRVRMLVSRSDFALDDPPVMRGIMVADHTVEHGTSWAVEFAVEGQASGGSAIGVADLMAPGVQRTGGVDPVVGSELVQVAAAGSSMGLWIALLFAFLGGMALNLMPCVFPVLAVKVLGFVRHGGGDVRSARLHGLAFGAGVLGSLWLLAGVLLVLRSAGEGVGWGFQLQSPSVVAVLTLVLFALALNLAGVFEVGVGLTRLGGIGGGEGFRDSFLTGGLAVVVATPCTAPFMGAALGYALVQPPLVGLSVFTALGVGLALPYMVLSSVPKLMDKLPRPGPWMVTFRQVLAFPMFATSVWLVWVFGQQQGIDAVAVLLLGLTLLGFAAWLGGRPEARASKTTQLLSAGALAAALMVSLGAGRVEEMGSPGGPGSLEWQTFSVAKVAELRSSGSPIFVDFTAAWCLSCQVNERIALRNGDVRAAFMESDVALLKADWTSRDPVIAEVLGSFGRSGVPLYVLYPADEEELPEILPAFLTPGLVIEAVGRASAVDRIVAGS